MRLSKTLLLVIPAVLISAFAYMAQAKSVTISGDLSAAPVTAWRSFSFGEGAFKMTVPTKPSCQDPDKGYYIQSHICTVPSDNTDITIEYVDLPSDEPLPADQIEKMYSTLLAEVADRVHGELGTASDIVVNHVPGKSYDVKVAGGVIQYRSFIHHGFAASVGVSAASHPRAGEKALDFDRVLSSFMPI